MIRAVFLDVFGTLLRMGEPEHAYVEIMGRHGYVVSADQVKVWIREAHLESRRLPSGPFPDLTISHRREDARRGAMIDALLRRAGVEQNVESCRAAIREAWVGEPVFRLYSDTEPVLAELKAAGLVVGAVSNWDPRLPELCDNIGIGGYLDFVIASEAEGFVKPSNRLFRLALERAGVQPEEAVHVGDSLVEDIQGAEAAGVRPIWIQREGSPRSPGPVPAAKPMRTEAVREQHSPVVSSLEAVLPLVKAAAWIRGRVASGKGEAASFTEVEWVRQQATERLGFRPYPGTLNLVLDEPSQQETWSWLRRQPGIEIEPQPGYCAARCYPVSVEGEVSAAIVLPTVADYPSDAVEVLAPVSLRERFGLRDGERQTLAVVGAQSKRVA